MPTKRNRRDQQPYVPAGHGDESGEYRDNAYGGNAGDNSSSSSATKLIKPISKDVSKEQPKEDRKEASDAKQLIKPIESTSAEKAALQGLTEKAYNVITSYEDTKRKLKHEEALITDKDGNVLLQKRGKSDRVTFYPWETARMKGAILTHNHPENSVVLSPEDVYAFVKYDQYQLRATDFNGNVAVMTRIEGVQVDPKLASHYGVIRGNAKNKAEAEFYKRIRAGEKMEIYSNIRRKTRHLQDFPEYMKLFNKHFMEGIGDLSKYGVDFKIHRKGE